jgi:hypothetical protein
VIAQVDFDETGTMMADMALGIAAACGQRYLSPSYHPLDRIR